MTARTWNASRGRRPRRRPSSGPFVAAVFFVFSLAGAAEAQTGEEEDFDEVFGEIEDEFPDEESEAGDSPREADDPANAPAREADDARDAPAGSGTELSEPPSTESRSVDDPQQGERTPAGSDGEADDPGKEDEAPPQGEDVDESFQLSGYVQPALGVRYRPDGVPRDQWEFGADATRIGVQAEGSPVQGWHYNLHIVIGGEILSPLTDVSVIDRVGDGAPNAIDKTSQITPGLFFEEATVSYAPSRALELKVGQMRIPFTVQHQSPNTSLMFPQRAGPNEVFLKDTDLGALTTTELGSVTASAGVFNGTGSTPFASSTPFDPSCECNRVVRGLMYSGRVDVSPLGSFPLGVKGTEDQPLRLGVGAGLLYFPYSTFDSSGFANAQVRDLRASASFRVAYGGFSGQAEFLRRQQTDSLSSRPVLSTGGYGQLSYYVPLEDHVGFAPIGRWGTTVEDHSFDARTTYWTEAGLTLYVHPRRGARDDEVRVTLHYLDERRVTEGENAHGMLAQLQMQW